MRMWSKGIGERAGGTGGAWGTAADEGAELHHKDSHYFGVRVKA